MVRERGGELTLIEHFLVNNALTCYNNPMS